MGVAAGNGTSPPYREPDLAHDLHYPYCVDPCSRDVREWVAATEVDERRHGQLFVFAFGAVARRILDDLEIGDRQYGVDLLDGRGGHCHVSSVELIFRLLEARFQVRQGAGVFRICLGFFKFTPRRGERPEVWFQRFDPMLEEADHVVVFGLGVTFQFLMVLSFLQFSPRKWACLLTDLGHRLPRDRQEHVTLQRAILRERILEGSACDVRDGFEACPAFAVITL